MTAPYLAAVVLVNVDATHNHGSPLAPAVITCLNPDGTVNVRVAYDTNPLYPSRHRPEHLTDIAFHDTTDPATAMRQGQYGAFWPSGGALDLGTIHHLLEELMAAQDDINAAVTAVQAVTADLTTAAANIQAEIATLNSELAAAGQPQVDTTALNAAIAPLQAAQAAVDALETPAAPAAPAAPAGGTAGSTVAAGDSGSAA